MLDLLYVQRPTGKPSRWAEETIHCDGFTRRRRVFYYTDFPTLFPPPHLFEHRNNRIVRFSTLYTTAWIGKVGVWTAEAILGSTRPGALSGWMGLGTAGPGLDGHWDVRGAPL